MPAQNKLSVMLTDETAGVLFCFPFSSKIEMAALLLYRNEEDSFDKRVNLSRV